MSRGKKYGLNRDVSRSSTCMHLLLSLAQAYIDSTPPQTLKSCFFPTISSFAEIGWRSRNEERERVNVRVWTTRGYIECAATEATGKRWTRGNFHPRRDYFFFLCENMKKEKFLCNLFQSCWMTPFMFAIEINECFENFFLSLSALPFCSVSHSFSTISLWLKIHFDAIQARILSLCFCPAPTLFSSTKLSPSHQLFCD